MKTAIGLIILFSCGLVGCLPKHFINGNDGSVILYLRAPKAGQVQFASSTDNYKIRDIYKNGLGLWEVSLRDDKEFRYFYVVDGMVYLPDCQLKEYDDFGTQNCIYQP